eukprot:Clim_evm19s141 gene=Clim_evmTU19s141
MPDTKRMVGKSHEAYGRLRESTDSLGAGSSGVSTSTVQNGSVNGRTNGGPMPRKSQEAHAESLPPAAGPDEPLPSYNAAVRESRAAQMPGTYDPNQPQAVRSGIMGPYRITYGVARGETDMRRKKAFTAAWCIGACCLCTFCFFVGPALIICAPNWGARFGAVFGCGVGLVIVGATFLIEYETSLKDECERCFEQNFAPGCDNPDTLDQDEPDISSGECDFFKASRIYMPIFTVVGLAMVALSIWGWRRHYRLKTAHLTQARQQANTQGVQQMQMQNFDGNSHMVNGPQLAFRPGEAPPPGYWPPGVTPPVYGSSLSNGQPSAAYPPQDYQGYTSQTPPIANFQPANNATHDHSLTSTQNASVDPPGYAPPALDDTPPVWNPSSSGQ